MSTLVRSLNSGLSRWASSPPITRCSSCLVIGLPHREVLNLSDDRFMQARAGAHEAGHEGIGLIVAKNLAVVCREAAAGLAQDEIARGDIPFALARERHHGIEAARGDQAEAIGDGVAV